jgi:ubiquinone/menaquinone biosynthesis C-methylase UbiE
MTDQSYWKEQSSDYAGRYNEPQTILEREKRKRLSNAIDLADHLLGSASGSILEIGVGSGNLLDLLTNTESKLVGVDFSKEMIGLAANRVPSAKFVRGTADFLPIKTNSIKVCFCLGVIGHLELDNPNVLISEIGRVLEPDGSLIFSFANSHSPFRKLRSIYFQHCSPEAHRYSTYKPEEISKVLNSNGFEIEASRYLTFSSGIIDTRIHKVLNSRIEQYGIENNMLSNLAMTWVIRTRRQ